MTESRFTGSQTMATLKRYEGGESVAELCREYGTSQATLYKLPSKYDGMDEALMRRLTELEAENARLKRKNAEGLIESDLRQEALEGIPQRAH